MAALYPPYARCCMSGQMLLLLKTAVCCHENWSLSYRRKKVAFSWWDVRDLENQVISLVKLMVLVFSDQVVVTVNTALADKGGLHILAGLKMGLTIMISQYAVTWEARLMTGCNVNPPLLASHLLYNGKKATNPPPNDSPAYLRQNISPGHY